MATENNSKQLIKLVVTEDEATFIHSIDGL